MAGCPDPSVLEAFAQGTLDSASRTQLELHLDTCRDCSDTLAELIRLFGSASWGASIAASGDDTLTTGGASAATGSHPGPAVGRYQLGKQLGAGGMGVVFEAHDPELHRNVAIKLLHPGTSAMAEKTRTRLLREARAMARLAHPNVVAVHDVGRAGEQVFVAMELVQGTTLRRWLAAKQRTQAEILATFVQAGRGLQAAHDVGLVHRDFKPDNVLIGADERARVTDFGLAQPAFTWAETEPVPAAASGVDPMLLSMAMTTAHGAIEGTPAYMAPEQWRGETADARSDQFSFCVALYEALFSSRPFRGAHWTALCHSVLGGDLIPPQRSAPSWLRAALVRGLAGAPGERHPSMEALIGTLTRDRRRALRIGAVVGAMGLGAAATVGVLSWAADTTTPNPTTAPQSESEQAGAAAEKPKGDAAPPPPEPAAAAVEVTPPVDERAQCVTSAAHADGHWTPARRTTLREHLLTMERGDALVDEVLPVIDAWAELYTAQAKALCEAATADPIYARCLARAVPWLDALAVQAVEHEKFNVQESIGEAVYQLPNIERCGSPPWRAAMPPPPAPDVAAKVQLLVSDLSAAEVDAALRRLTSAPADAERVQASASELGYAPLNAEAQLSLGRIATVRYQTDIAVSWLEQAAVTAEGAKHEIVRGEAALRLVVAQGAGQLLPAAAKRWQRVARSFADTANDARLSAAATLADGILQHAILELRDGKATLAKALGEYEAAFPAGHPEVAAAHLALSAVLVDLGEAEQAETHANKALEILTAATGPTSLETGKAHASVARALLAAGKGEDALRAATLAVKAVFPSKSLRHDYDRGDALLVRGDAEAATGDTTAALATYDTARIHHYTGARKFEPSLRKGALLASMGKTKEGLAELDAALVEAQLHYSSDDPRLVRPLRALGRAQASAGKTKDARLTLQRAYDIADTKLGYGPFKARSTLDLARLEQAAGKKKRALELFDDAHVPWVGAYDMGHPKVLATLLARADLAYALGQREYAGRLYRSSAKRFEAHYGENSPEAKRARARRTSE
ncbi:MAG: protein kinase [Myxococcota bacterium]